MRKQMHLRMLREHYTLKGNVLVPKKSFKSEKEISQLGFYPQNWHAYTCGECGNFHIASIHKKKVRYAR